MQPPYTHNFSHVFSFGWYNSKLGIFRLFIYYYYCIPYFNNNLSEVLPWTLITKRILETWSVFNRKSNQYKLNARCCFSFHLNFFPKYRIWGWLAAKRERRTQNRWATFGHYIQPPPPKYSTFTPKNTWLSFRYQQYMVYEKYICMR